jgi:hypothetical protein
MRFHGAGHRLRAAILSEGPGSWADVFAALDAAHIPEDFMSEAERDSRPPEPRPALDAFPRDE